MPEAVQAIARRRLGEVERELIALDKRMPLDGAWRVARRHLGRARRAVLGARYWCPDPPAEVAATAWPGP